MYLKCSDKYGNMMDLFSANKSTDLFVRKVEGSIGIKAYGGLVISNLTNFLNLWNNTNCLKEGGVWELYYGNPKEGGHLLAQDRIDRKLS